MIKSESTNDILLMNVDLAWVLVQKLWTHSSIDKEGIQREIEE